MPCRKGVIQCRDDSLKLSCPLPAIFGSLLRTLAINYVIVNKSIVNTGLFIFHQIFINTILGMDSGTIDFLCTWFSRSRDGVVNVLIWTSIQDHAIGGTSRFKLWKFITVFTLDQSSQSFCTFQVCVLPKITAGWTRPTRNGVSSETGCRDWPIYSTGNGKWGWPPGALGSPASFLQRNSVGPEQPSTSGTSDRWCAGYPTP